MSGRGHKGLGISSDKILIYMLYTVVLIVMLQHIEVFIGYTILVALLAIPYFLLRWYTKDKEKQQFLQSGLNELNSMDSVQFKKYVGALFESSGYAIEYTPKSGDYGTDFILHRGNYSIAVQAKRHIGSAGVKAVQEASSSKAYYKTNEVWAVTNHTFTKNAYHCAEKLNVKLIDCNDLIRMLSENNVMAKPQETRPT